MGTLKKRIEDPREITDPNVVKVVTDRAGNAIYFSRSSDSVRSRAIGEQPRLFQTHRAVRLSARFPAALFRLCRSGRSKQAERLEQLRALENGYRIRVVETEYESLGVDTPEDLERVIRLFDSINLTGE